MVDIVSISHCLRQADDGIWYSVENKDLSYPPDGNDTCFSVEDSSFWFRHRNACIETVVSGFPPPDGGEIFDIGGGNGYVSSGLVRAGFDVVLVEPGRAGAANARRRGLQDVVCASTDTAGFHPESFPAVGLFDVIEHVENDCSFLESIGHLVKKGGRVYATVPAYSVLWSQEDIQAGHHRRYSLSEIQNVFQTAGFSVNYATYIFRLLPLPTLIMRAIPYRLGLSSKNSAKRDVAKDHIVKQGWISAILNYYLRGELKCLQRKTPMRFGGSCLLVATRV